ncbi:MAG: hypothetical protein P4M11_03790 [Candidatus Pacebacteria bacterium]|nr:hypothetical protein [Candidatus Paceibacterota bacterium]
MIRAGELLAADPDYNHSLALVNVSDKRVADLVDFFRPKKFPAILVFGQQTKYKAAPYKGEFTAEALASAIKSATLHHAIRLNTTAELMTRVNAFMESFILGVFENEDNELYRRFVNASEHIPLLRFYYMVNPKQNNITKARLPTDEKNYALIIHNPFFTENDTEAQLVFYNETEHGSIELFIVTNFAHWVEICTQQTITIYNAQRIRYLAFFTDVYDNLNRTRSVALQLKDIAGKFFDRMRICLANIERGGMLNRLVGDQVGEVVLFEYNASIYQGSGMYGPDEKNVTGVRTKKLEKWIGRYFSGKLAATDFKAKIKDVISSRNKRANATQHTSAENGAAGAGKKKAEKEEKAKTPPNKVDL